MKKKTKSSTPDLPPFPNEFWENVLRIGKEDPERFKLFSFGFRHSATVYQEQRDRAVAAHRQAA
jgi:hypothetical protein